MVSTRGRKGKGNGGTNASFSSKSLGVSISSCSLRLSPILSSSRLMPGELFRQDSSELGSERKVETRWSDLSVGWLTI
jgi:hypothetical protein